MQLCTDFEFGLFEFEFGKNTGNIVLLFSSFRTIFEGKSTLV